MNQLIACQLGSRRCPVQGNKKRAASSRKRPALVTELDNYFFILCGTLTVADASVTLIRRAFRGKKIWRAHREHFYQQAVQKGQSHSAVVRLILMANLALLTLAALATMGWIWQAVFGACVVVLALLFFLGPHKKI